MKMLGGRPSTGRKIAVGAVAATTAVGLTLLTTSPGAADEKNPKEDSEALGQLIDADLLSEDAVDALSAYSSSPSSEAEDSTPLNLEVLQSLGLELPGIDLPLISSEGGDGLLELGEAGALNSYGRAASGNAAKASAGAVGEDGALNLDDVNNGDFGNAKVDLTSLLGQLNLDGVTDQIVDELSLELGAVGSTAESDGKTTDSEYVVADGTLTVSSPAVGGLSDELTKAVDGVGGSLDDAIGEEGLVDELSGLGLDVDAGLASVKIGGEDTKVSVDTGDALNSVVENVVNKKLEDESGIVSIDLANGDIKIDLAKVVKGADGEDLNGLDPNTQVLTSDTISKITDAVADALGALSGRVNETLTDALNDVHLNIALPANITAAGIPAADGKVTVDATLGQLAGTDDSEPVVDTDLSLAGVPVGTVVNAITGPVVQAVLGVTKPIIGGVLDSTTEETTDAVTGIVDPVLDGLEPVLSGLNEVVDLTINEQSPNPSSEGASAQSSLESSRVDGNNGPGFTVNAVSLELLPESDAIDVNLASSSVRATADDAPGDDDADADDSAAADQDDSADADSSSDPDAAADPDASAADDADSNVNVNAAASASASADADDDSNPAAQAASEAAADDDANDSASAEADASAEAAAESAATEDASSNTSADSTSDPNASSQQASNAAANADNSDSTNADSSAAADADPAAAASVASTADSSNEASVEAAANADDSAEADSTDEADASASSDDNADGAETSASADGDESDTSSDENASAAASASADVEAGADADASGSSDGGDLPRTGAEGTMAMAGLAALLIAGGAAAVYAARRHRNRGGL
ncbi:hypothetical protein GCM10010974_28890 [Brevibacterium sediminis]|uniref:Gram-positive cocci surface proteins LPxTG domain-containing protein n=1 Tax=Brevibacterium sediminis TaxID=1857024 RepID=A0ABQ1MQK7_9MICO|nr:choice-of-anchor G family protein [Brevibacterium sediminis]GGC44748.1 hypothetical protein GCM10010974_28890 [Brevibacterium sediminis]